MVPQPGCPNGRDTLSVLKIARHELPDATCVEFLGLFQYETCFAGGPQARVRSSEQQVRAQESL